jgi:hypothetical protein
MKQTKAYLQGVIADLRFKLWCASGGLDDPPINQRRTGSIPELLAEIERLRALINTVNPTHWHSSWHWPQTGEHSHQQKAKGKGQSMTKTPQRTWRVTLYNQHAMCGIYADGRTRRKAFDNAFHRAGPEFRHHTLADHYGSRQGTDVMWLAEFNDAKAHMFHGSGNIYRSNPNGMGVEIRRN